MLVKDVVWLVTDWIGHCEWINRLFGKVGL